MVSIFVLLLIFISVPTSAYAYMDLGTGTLIVQGILAAVVGGFVAFKLYWQKISEFICKTLGRMKGTQSDNH